MKKIFTTLVILVATFWLVPVFGCSQKMTEGFTGAACSIKELSNIEKTKNSREKVDFTSKSERNLRPVRIVPEIPKQIGDDCVFGVCLREKIFGK